MTQSLLSQLRVLLVDDNKFMQEILTTMLSALGIMQVTRAEDSAVALEILSANRFDFLIVDIEMRPLDGIELTQMIRTLPDSHQPYLPVIIVSGHTNRNIVERARDAGMNEFLAKPVTAQMLCTRIKQIIERPRPFVRTPTYSGPDRRRNVRSGFNRGRRAEDRGEQPAHVVIED